MKSTITGKEVKIDKETYDTLHDIMNTSKSIIKDMPSYQALFNELEDYKKTIVKLNEKNIMYKLRLENWNIKTKSYKKKIENFKIS